MARSAKQAAPGLPDTIEGVQTPRETATVFGQTAAEQELARAYQSGRAHHAWMLCGPRGIGKATLSFLFAKHCFVHKDPRSAPADVLAPQGDQPATIRVAHGTHSNLLHIHRTYDPSRNRFMSEISVAAVRRLVPFLGNTAGDGQWRFVIVDPADELNRNAANALLKALEEPPTRTLFLLIANRPGLLPPTIRSRCRRLDLAALKEAELKKALAPIDPAIFDGPEGALVSDLAGGSPRQALELVRGGGIAVYRDLCHAIADCDGETRYSLANRVAEPGKRNYRQFVTMFETYLQRRIHRLPEPRGISLPKEVPLVTWARLWEKAARSGREVETYNLDRREFALDLLEAARAAVHAR